MPSDNLNVLKRISKKIEQTEYYKGKIPKNGLISTLEQVIKKVEIRPKKNLGKKRR
jgi:hypothetical protein